jgi:Flp pilus assembly protein TadG
MRSHLRRLLGLPRCRRGNMLIEFAIGSGVLIAAFTGTFQFGYTFYEYNVLKNGVSDGARYAALRPYDSSSATPSDAFKTAVKNMVVYGDPDGGTNPIAPGLAASNVSVVPIFTNGVPTAMKVSITGFTIDAVFKSTTFTNKPSVTYPYQGIYSPPS